MSASPARLLAALLGSVASYAGPAAGQQSLFNVPSGEIAAPGRLFGQLQSTLTADRGEASLTVDLGVTRFWEVGFNLMRVPLWDRGQLSGMPTVRAPLDSAALINSSVRVTPARWLGLSAGLQAGVALGGRGLSPSPILNGWLLGRLSVVERRLTWIVGGYAGTESALGSGWPAGPMTGLELVVVRDRLLFMADWIVGLNSASVAVLGLVVHLTPEVQLSLGAQVPSPGAANPPGAVIELTVLAEPMETRGGSEDSGRSAPTAPSARERDIPAESDAGSPRTLAGRGASAP
jgi:hypothetical protein